MVSPAAYRSAILRFCPTSNAEGRPNFLPCSRALRIPASVRARISDRSNSLMPLRIVTSNLPAGEVVSHHGSAKLVKPQPASCRSCTMLSRSRLERARRSRRVTTTTSQGLRARIRRLNSGLPSTDLPDRRYALGPVDSPDHGPPSLVRLSDDGLVRDFDPNHVFGAGGLRHAHPIVTVRRHPIGVFNNIAVSE